MSHLSWQGGLHHIKHDAEGGSGEYDNGIPVCLDCHAEIESKSNMGRGFTPTGTVCLTASAGASRAALALWCNVGASERQH